MKRKFAAFDIDGTISRNALFYQIVDGLIDHDYLPKDKKELLAKKFEAYKKREHKHAYKDFTSLAVEVLKDNLAKIKVADYRKVVDEIVPRNTHYTYTYTTGLIEKLRAEGYFLIALSGSEKYSVNVFCERLGFDIALGEEYFEKNGYFTGELEQVVHRKEIFLKKFVKEHDLTLEGSIAIGDSAGDITMLEFVEHPIAFNPEDTLFEKAKTAGWDIVIERKNVVYTLKEKDGSYLLA
jgi:HAD superfamily hydrolase (TIGR01490 family)